MIDEVQSMWVCIEIDPVLCDWGEDKAERTWKGFSTKEEAERYDASSGKVLAIVEIRLQ